MTPTEIRDLLTAACPELTWEIVDVSVVAKGTEIAAVSHHLHAFTIGHVNRPGTTVLRDRTTPTLLAHRVRSLLSTYEIMTVPGADRLTARADLLWWRATIKAHEAELSRAYERVATVQHNMQEAREYLDAAEAEAKRLGVTT